MFSVSVYAGLFKYMLTCGVVPRGQKKASGALFYHFQQVLIFGILEWPRSSSVLPFGIYKGQIALIPAVVFMILEQALITTEQSPPSTNSF